MITKELVFYIKQAKSLGKTNDQIKSTLLANGGWASEDIEEGFRQASIGDVAASAPAPVVNPAMRPVTAAPTIAPNIQSTIQPNIQPRINTQINPQPQVQTQFQPQPIAQPMQPAYQPAQNMGMGTINPINAINTTPLMNPHPAVQSPGMTPLMNSRINDIASQRSFAPQTTARPQPIKKSHGSTIFAIFLIFILAIGAAGYFFRDSLISLPFIQNLLPITPTPQAQSPVTTGPGATNTVADQVQTPQPPTDIGMTTEVPGNTTPNSSTTPIATAPVAPITPITPTNPTSPTTTTPPATGITTSSSTCAMNAYTTNPATKLPNKPFTTTTLLLNTNTTNLISINNNKGTADQVVWISDDPAISSTNVSTGSKLLVIGNKIGKTVIRATDTSVGSSCTVTLNMIVSQ